MDDAEYQPIENYGIIGDRHTVALDRKLSDAGWIG